MAELVVTHKDQELCRRVLEDGSVTVGRGVGNDIRLNSPTVGSRHARISLFGSDCHIQHLAAPGDTFVNGREVQRAQLFDRDVIHIGHFKIELQAHEELPRRPSDKDPATKRDRAADGGHDDSAGRRRASAIPADVLEQISELEQTLGPYLNKRRNAETKTPDIPATEPSKAEAEIATETGDPQVVGTGPSVAQAPADMVDVTIETAAVEGPAETVNPTPEAPAAESDEITAHSMLSTGVDILSGPAKGKRIYFTQQTVKLGAGSDPALTIQAAENGYIATAANSGIVVAINGAGLLHEPVPLDDGDTIDFANLRARFFTEP